MKLKFSGAKDATATIIDQNPTTISSCILLNVSIYFLITSSPTPKHAKSSSKINTQALALKEPDSSSCIAIATKVYANVQRGWETRRTRIGVKDIVTMVSWRESAVQ